VEVRRTTLLWFNGAEVLHIPAHAAPGVSQNRSSSAGKWMASRAAWR
jgi:hypothetical protein